MQQFGTGAACQIAGASKRQLDYWVRTGLVKPNGKGDVHRRYLFADIVAVKTAVELQRQGCSLQQVRKAVKYLRANYPAKATADVLSGLMLLTDGKFVYMYTDRKQIMDVVSKQTVLWIVNVGKLIAKAREDAAALPMEWTEPVTIAGNTYRLRVMSDLDSGGYAVQCAELPGAIEQGDTVEEAIRNGKAAIESVLAFTAKRTAGRNPRIKKRA